MQVQSYNFSDPKQTDIANKEVNKTIEKNKANMDAFKVSSPNLAISNLKGLEHELIQNAMNSQHLLTKIEVSKYDGNMPEIKSAIEDLKTRLKAISSQEKCAARMVDIDIGIHKLNDELTDMMAKNNLSDLEQLAKKIDVFANKTAKTLEVIGKDEAFTNSVDMKECLSRLNVLTELTAGIAHKKSTDNLVFLKKLINEYSNEQLYQFLVDQKIDPMEGWFVKEGQPAPLALQQTSFLTLAERKAQAFIDKGDIQAAIAVRIMAAQAFPPAGPLIDIQLVLQKADAKLGLHLYPIDTGLFKNHDLMVQKRNVDGEPPHLHLESKLSHPARNKMDSTLKFIASHAKDFHSTLPKGFCQEVSVSEEQAVYYQRKADGNFSPKESDGFTVHSPAYQACKVQLINFKGVGTVRIGISDPVKYEAMQNRITIDLDSSIPENEAAEKLNIIFSALGVGTAASALRPIDEERIKVFQLFRAFHPSEAYAFERDPNTFNESIQSLTTRIEKKVPEMQGLFKRYLKDEPNLMYQQEVYPGQFVWCIKGLADEVKKEGAIGLMSGVTAPDFKEACKRIVSILKTGALSTQDRFQIGITISGDSSAEDLRTGGGRSVFIRMLTDNMPLDPKGYPLKGAMNILYDLKLVERVGYAYAGDQYGTKDPSVYSKRPNIIALTKKYKASKPNAYLGNEVCVNHRVGPEFIKGMLVKDTAQKDELTMLLRNEGLLTKNNKNEECFNNIPIDQFIHVGNFDAAYWA